MNTRKQLLYDLFAILRNEFIQQDIEITKCPGEYIIFRYKDTYVIYETNRYHSSFSTYVGNKSIQAWGYMYGDSLLTIYHKSEKVTFLEDTHYAIQELIKYGKRLSN